MTTKYILQSGGMVRNAKRKKEFHDEVIRGFSAGGNVRILLCHFSHMREMWEVRFPGYCEMLKQDMPEHNLTFELAMPDTFEDQVARADVLYCHGGDNDLIEYRMSRYALPDIWKGKVVATNSASSQLLAQSYWTNDWRMCRNGFGILPIKFIPHFRSQNREDPRGPVDWDAAYEDLQNFGDTSLPIYALEEGDFRVVSVDS